MFPSAANDSDLIQLLRTALQDPTKAAALRQALATQGGPPTLQNTLQAAGLAAQKSNSPIGSLAGALAGAGANYFKRSRKKPGTVQSTGDADRGGNYSSTDTGGGGPMGSGGGGGITGGATAADVKAIPNTGTPIPGNLQMGQDRYGNDIHSNDGGATWVSLSGAPVAGPAYNPTNIGTVGGGGAPTGGFASGDFGGEFSGNAGSNMSGAGQLEDLGSAGDFGGEFAKGGMVKPKVPKKAILLRRPGGKMAIPVISTTIVIARHKPEKKGEKKAHGGVKLEPRKPEAIPPKHGPGNGDVEGAPFRKGGRVQVPRGSGIAQRGKRFSGIF
jgi:hypothetical protein